MSNTTRMTPPTPEQWVEELGYCPACGGRASGFAVLIAGIATGFIGSTIIYGTIWLVVR